MDAYSRKRNIMENIEMERQKVNGRIGNNCFFFRFFSFAAVSFLFSLSPPEVDHDQAPPILRARVGG
jgi:hypothetical protein